MPKTQHKQIPSLQEQEVVFKGLMHPYQKGTFHVTEESQCQRKGTTEEQNLRSVCFDMGEPLLQSKVAKTQHRDYEVLEFLPSRSQTTTRVRPYKNTL